jgi:TonB family protein
MHTAAAVRSPATFHIQSPRATTQSSSKGFGFVVSLFLHALLGVGMLALSIAVTEEEPPPPPPEKTIETVLIRMPSPEPPGSEAGGGPSEVKEETVARPKALARRAVQANVSQFKNIVQQQVTQITPNQVFGQVTKVQVSPTQRTQAPREVAQRVIEARTVDELSDVEMSAPSAVPSATPTLRNAPTMVQSSGPRAVDAAGPVVKQSGLDYQQATLAEGVADNVTVQGDATGPRIRALQTGGGSMFGSGVGRGSGSGGGSGNGEGSGDGNGSGEGSGDGTGRGNGSRDCNKDQQCSAYLAMIRERMYQRWNPGRDVPGGEVQLSFRIDKSGSAHGIRLVRSANLPLGESCVTAFRHASPFPPPPANIAYLLGKNLIATFDFSERN